MIDKCTLSKVILQSFAHRRKYARKTTSEEKRKKCKDVDKIRIIVDYYNNHYIQELHLDLLTDEITSEEMQQWEAIWKGLRGEDFFNKMARWCGITLEDMYCDALKANARLGNKKTEQAMLGDSNLEVKMADYLNSIIEDCNCYLLKNVLVHLDVKENKKRGRNKLR
jgi:hypothetical protein